MTASVRSVAEAGGGTGAEKAWPPLNPPLTCVSDVCVGKRNADILTMVVRGGGKASLNHPEWSRHNKGASPLHTAARLGQIDNARLLLQLGAEVNVVDASGQTALHVAAVHEITGRSADLIYTCMTVLFVHVTAIYFTIVW